MIRVSLERFPKGYMETLFQLKAVAICVLALVSSVRAESYCSLIVQVVDKNNREFEATINVRESDGTMHVKRQRARWCSFLLLGLLPVDVIVGNENCNQVTVRSIPIDYQETVLTKIVYDRATCLYDPPPDIVPSCKFLLRIYDQEKRPIQKASVRIRSPQGNDLTTDHGGRAMVLVRRGTGLIATVSAAGHHEEKVDLNCPRVQDDERKIELKKLP